MQRYKLIYYVPLTHLAQTKEAIFKTGAGDYQKYDNVCFESIGTGQFRAKKGASPFLGKIDQLEIVKEAKVEILVFENCIKNAVSALKESHPYEEVAYDVYKLEDF